jgi:hypothetical protein
MDTATLMHRFNAAFQQHNPALLDDLVAEDCVIENTDGQRHAGRAACLALWRGIAGNREAWFDLEDIIALGDRGIIYWHYHWGDGPADSVRGVNLMQVRDGKIVEARGYVKGK